MSWTKRFLEDQQQIDVVYTCPHCGEDFGCCLFAQEPGFRWEEDLKCPHCGKVIKTSLEWEFHPYVL